VTRVDAGAGCRQVNAHTASRSAVNVAEVYDGPIDGAQISGPPDEPTKSQRSEAGTDGFPLRDDLGTE
jgi:hypothetical protein